MAHALVTRQRETGEEKLRATDQMMNFIGEAGGLGYALLERWTSVISLARVCRRSRSMTGSPMVVVGRPCS